MQYFSTNHESPTATFGDALLAGQPGDGGLYFPSEIPKLSSDWLAALPGCSSAEIAFDVIRPYVGGNIPDDTLREICSETVNFEFPIVGITPQISTLELFHGPTLAFKDVGARFMSRCLRHLSPVADRQTVVIVATSGDTGGAVAAGFHNVGGIEVVILFPKGKVSRVQEMQLTRLGGNVITLELQGTFDDCQAIAKRALAETDLRERANLTSANSINIARWLPQQFYYFFALQQWHDAPPVIAVPSGNFGNLASGILAWKSGLPVKRFVAACNANDVVPRYLASGKYEPYETVPTLSNAMDVGAPSNFVRILEMFDDDRTKLSNIMHTGVIDDARTVQTMKYVFEETGYILDPHGAVGYAALADDLADGERGLFLETAHPAKFDSVGEILDRDIPVPEAVQTLASQPASSITVENDYDDVRDIILSRI